MDGSRKTIMRFRALHEAAGQRLLSAQDDSFTFAVEVWCWGTV